MENREIERVEVWQKEQFVRKDNGWMVEKWTSTETLLSEYYGVIQVIVGARGTMQRFQIPAVDIQDAFQQFQGCADATMKEIERQANASNIIKATPGMMNGLNGRTEQGNQHRRIQ